MSIQAVKLYLQNQSSMVKAYYYLLYRIYIFYTEKMKEEQVPLIYVASISTLLIFINLFTLFGALSYYDLIPMFPNKYYVIATIIILWVTPTLARKLLPCLDKSSGILCACILLRST